MVLYGVVIADQIQSRRLTGPPAAHYRSVNLPLLGEISWHWVMYLGLLFLAGATLELFRDRIVIHDGLGCLAALVGSLLAGGFFLIGFPALVYVLVWLGVRMPRRLRWVGRRNDYSYGTYIKGFIGQQILSSIGWSRRATCPTPRCPSPPGSSPRHCRGTWWRSTPWPGRTGHHAAAASRNAPGCSGQYRPEGADAAVHSRGR